MLLPLLGLALTVAGAPTSNITSNSSIGSAVQASSSASSSASAATASATATGAMNATSSSSSNSSQSSMTMTLPMDEGSIPYSLTASYDQPSATSIALQPTPTLNGTAEVAALWSTVEAAIPVQTAAITTLKEVPGANYSYGADPPAGALQPSWLISTAQNFTFPKGFIYGAATAATQVEGAQKTDGKGPDAWNWLCHVYPDQCNGFTSDITTNMYYNYPEDFARMKYLGMNAHSFSFAWTRILPLASGDVNQAGLDFYNRFIDSMVSNGLEPIATLFHWDSPMAGMIEYGGIADTGDRFVQDFVNYANITLRAFGSKVKTWVTFNEPGVFCSQIGGLPYNLTYPEGINKTSAPYRCAYNLLRAHGETYRLYHDLIDQGVLPKGGQMAFKNDDNWPLPYRANNTDDLEVAQRHADFHIGLYSQPVYGNGTYPQRVVDTVGDMLPALTEEDVKIINGSQDFFAYDGYRTDVVRAAFNGIDSCAKNISDPNWPICSATNTANKYGHSFEDGWGIGYAADTAVPWLYNTAAYLRRQLRYLTTEFPSDGGIYVSEFGFSEVGESARSDEYIITWDTRRAIYFRDYLTECLLAIHEDGINLRGTLAWSIVDNFEWQSGLSSKFGIQYVNQSSPNLERTYKLSAHVLRDFGKQHLQAN